jgi:hypothetical protein
MGFADKFKDLSEKAKDTAVQHKDQINQAVETAAAVADKRTKGRYRNQIFKATERTGAMVEKLAADQAGAGSEKPAPPPTTPAGDSEAPTAPPGPAPSDPPAGG